MKSKIFEKVLNDISIDPRISDGVFDMSKNEHMDVLRDYLIGKGIEETCVHEFCNIVVEGKYPERQAYNANGILVTFPTPQYKKEAIARGTHFENDPTRGRPNIFAGGAGEKSPATSPPGKQSSPTKTSLPISTSSTKPADSDDSGESSSNGNEPNPQSLPPEAFTTAAPQQTPSGVNSEPDEPTELPPPQPKSPQEKVADKDMIKKMLKGDDYMLEEVSDWLENNAPTYLTERFKKALIYYER
jgi:hypothetical protein